MKYTVLSVDQAGPYIVGEFSSKKDAITWVESTKRPKDYEIKPTKDVGFIW